MTEAKRPKGQLDPYQSTPEAADQAQLEEEPESLEGPEPQVKQILDPSDVKLPPD